MFVNIDIIFVLEVILIIIILVIVFEVSYNLYQKFKLIRKKKKFKNNN
ncbi:MAG: hypothetical protein GY932_03230 [Arcobacter sp.]|nr:hypothetical protein [Arcobacter sp.]